MRVYLTQPMAGYDKQSINIKELKAELIKRGHTPLDPYDFEVVSWPDKKVVETDLELVESSDILFADFTNPSLGGGCWGEFYHAYQIGVPILVLAPDVAYGFWMRYHSKARLDSNMYYSASQVVDLLEVLAQEYPRDHFDHI